MSSAVEQPKVRTRRDRRRPATLQRIVDATLALIMEGGTASLSKAAICKRAGIHASAIYSYFPTLDACIRAAVVGVSETFADRAHRTRQLISQSGEWTPERNVSMIAASLRIQQEDWQNSVLIVRCQHEDSPVGEAIREAFEHAVRLLSEDLFVAAVRMGITNRRPEDFLPAARLVNTSFQDALAMLVHYPERDLDELAEIFGQYVFSGITGVMRKMRRDDAQAEAN